MAEETEDPWLVRVQALSGAVFSLFLLAHLANHMLAAWGEEAYDEAQRSLRSVYQSPAIEIGLVVVPLVVHAACGVIAKVRRRRAGRTPPADARMRLHRWAGNFLLAMALVHVLVSRGVPLLLDLPLGFAGLAFAFQHMPVDMAVFLAFAVAGLYHALHGLGLALPRLGVPAGAGLRRPAVLAPLTGFGGLLLLAGVLGFGGVLFDTPGVEEAPLARWLVENGLIEPRGSDDAVVDHP
jgi:succinate dehydrogenase/fumarate reductase cytochrome b subunit